jgi:hypothetical protein
MLLFSEFSGAEPQGWLDIDLDHDQKSFIDPLKFHKVNDPDFDGDKAELLLRSYMAAVDSMIGHPEMTASRRALLEAPCEMNETRLGLGQRKPHGSGTSPEMLEQIFLKAHSIENFKIIEHMEALLMFTPRFGADRLSDLVTCVISSELVKYTQRKCRRHGIDMQKDCVINSFNPETLAWEKLTVELPVKDNLPILLVPVEVLVEAYDYTAQHYVRFEVLESRKHNFQQQGRKMSKDDIYELDTADILYDKCKTYALREAIKNPKQLIEYLEKRRSISIPKVLGPNLKSH